MTVTVEGPSDTRPVRQGRINYLEQGFVLHWDEHGLRIEVTDYHAAVLQLSWGDIFALAKVAGSPPAGSGREQ